MSERDLTGYGPTPPFAGWPGWARVAVNFVVHYEEGAGHILTDGSRATDGLHEYGSRAGFWRLHRLFTGRQVPVTVFGFAQAMEQNPQAVDAMLTAGWELATRGWRPIDDQVLAEAAEREDLARAIDIHTRLTGERPLGWHRGRTSPDTARLVAEEGGFVYDSDSFADDLPYYDRRYGRAQLILPCSPDTDDRLMIRSGGFTDGEQVFRQLRDTFEQLRQEGGRMMSVGLRGRIAGSPGYALAVSRFVDHVLASGDAWITRRIDIARHWLERHPA